MPTVIELDAINFVQLKYDCTHTTVSGKPKNNRFTWLFVSPLPIFSKFKVACCDDAGVWGLWVAVWVWFGVCWGFFLIFFFITPNPKVLTSKEHVRFFPLLHSPCYGYTDACFLASVLLEVTVGIAATEGNGRFQ